MKKRLHFGGEGHGCVGDNIFVWTEGLLIVQQMTLKMLTA